jgi:predicted RNA-binding protein Jag
MEQHLREMKKHHHDMAEFSVQYASAQRVQMQQNHEAAVAAVQSYQGSALDSLQALHHVAAFQAEDFTNKMELINGQLVRQP